MEGLSITLARKDSAIVCERREGLLLTIQNLGVNLAQIKGTSTVFPKKGTSLFKQSLRGMVVNMESANRYGGLAAVDTLFFMRENALAAEREYVADLAVIPVTASDGVLYFTAKVRTSTGTLTETTV